MSVAVNAAQAHHVDHARLHRVDENVGFRFGHCINIPVKRYPKPIGAFGDD
jgi:hypothetical protein